MYTQGMRREVKQHQYHAKRTTSRRSSLGFPPPPPGALSVAHDGRISDSASASSTTSRPTSCRTPIASRSQRRHHPPPRPGSPASTASSSQAAPLLAPAPDYRSRSKPKSPRASRDNDVEGGSDAARVDDGEHHGLGAGPVGPHHRVRHEVA